MAQFKAYFDESGTHVGSPIAIVAGAVAKELSWDALNRKWSAILKKHDVAKFHANELNACRGDFSGWTDRQRNSFYEKLLRVIKEELTVFIVNGVKTDEFAEVSQQFPEVELSPYQYLLEHSLMGISAWAKQKRHLADVAVYVARAQKYETPITKNLPLAVQREDFQKFWKISEFIVTRNTSDVPFQVADLICYEHFRFHKAGGSENPSILLRSWKVGYAMRKKHFGVFSSKDMVEQWFQLKQELLETRRRQ